MDSVMRIVIFIALCFSAFAAQAESGSVTLDSSRMLLQANQQAEDICAQLKRDPRCQYAQNLMQSVLGLSVESCRSTKAAAHCEAFIAKYPQYRTKQMSCDPQEVCRQALPKDLGKSCAEYGIKIGEDMVHLAIKAGICLGKIDCTGRKMLQLMEFIADPIAQERLQMKIAAGLIDGVRDDLAKFPKLACLDVDTQNEFACYSVAKYGSLAMGAAGAGRSVATAFASAAAREEMEILESTLVNERGLAVAASDRLPAAAEESIRKAAVDIAKKKFSGDDVLPRIRRTIDDVTDPQVREAMHGVLKQIRDPQAWSRYTTQLMRDAFKEQIEAGGELAAKAARGELSRTAVLRVLVRRAQARGETIGVATKTLNQSQFGQKVAEGPFFDRAFKVTKGEKLQPFDYKHGADTHLIQRDFAAKTVEQTYPNDSNAVYRFLGSDRGMAVWEEMFDAMGDDPRSPEYLSGMLNPHLHNQ